MTIAINAAFFFYSPGNDFFYDRFMALAACQPKHRFIFIVSPVNYKPAKSFENITMIVSAPGADNPLMWKIWLNYTLPGIARKHRAEILIHTGGACSLRTKTPQCVFISDLSFFYFPQFFSKKQLGFLKKNLPAFLEKATTIVTASDFLTKEIAGKYALDEKKITSFQINPAGIYQPIGWEEKEAIREKYTEGKEYFLFSGEIHLRSNLINLLKAFSFFKKRQKSNMQLIIIAIGVVADDRFSEDLKTYKFRKEVVFLTGLPENEHAKITAAAYAFVYPVLYEGMALFPLRAVHCEVPVIAGNIPAIVEKVQQGGLYFDPASFEDIADKMMLLFKDENKRAALINKKNRAVRENVICEANEILWQVIFKTGARV